MGKLLRHLKSVLTICFGHTGSFVKQFQNGLPGFIELIGVVGNAFFSANGTTESDSYAPPFNSLLILQSPAVIPWPY